MTQFSQHNFKNEKALVRVDFNVPLDDNFHITDDSRMTAALPTINKILADGGSIILMSHFGRPKGEKQAKFSLNHLLTHLKELLPGVKVLFANDCIGEEAKEK
ncbi:MAG: phosphoglycerate kinase, partial [Ginsengibacter sp.]